MTGTCERVPIGAEARITSGEGVLGCASSDIPQANLLIRPAFTSKRLPIGTETQSIDFTRVSGECLFEFSCVNIP